MVLEVVWSMLKGLGMFFVHPLIYISLLFLFLLGYRRVKRERQSFHARVYDTVEETFSAIVPSLLVGCIVTAITIAVGFVFPFEWLAMLAAVYLLLLLTFQTRLASPAYGVGVTIGLTYVLMNVTTGITWVDSASATFSSTLVANAMILLALLVIAEGVLIRVYASKRTSPRNVISNRGKYHGAHLANRLYVLPVGFFLPNGTIETIGDWWPVLTLGGETGFSFIVVPLLVGVFKQVTSGIPALLIERSGQKVIGFGVLLLVITIGAYFYQEVLLYVAILALFSREVIWQIERYRDKKATNYFSLRSGGLVILGIIPGSQAEKMALEVGEIITKVNGSPVHNEQTFYQALQRNSAYCKLEVLDVSGELRFAQTALYDGQHYQIGVLFTKEQVELQDSVI